MSSASSTTLAATAEGLLELVVVHREDAAEGIVVVHLAAASGAMLPAFEAGAHVVVHLGDGLVRPYSLCGSPADRSRYRLGILLDTVSRGGSAAVHRDLHPGRFLRVSAPRNHFALARDARLSVLIGGGIGITPLLAMAHQLQADGRSFQLHYFARAKSRAAFLPELAAATFAAQVELHLDDAPAAQRREMADLLPHSGAATHLYVCGPSGFMDHVIGLAKAAGHADAQIHREYFAGQADVGGGSFQVELASSGRIIQVERDVSIVKALAGAGVRIDIACEEGVCGTCLCNVLGGEPDHRDVYLTDEEKAANDQMLLCCSRSKSPRLVLDL